MDGRNNEVLAAYAHNLTATLEVLATTIDIAKSANDQSMPGYLVLIGAQVKYLLDAVKDAQQRTSSESEESESEDKGYDLMDFWKFMGKEKNDDDT